MNLLRPYGPDFSAGRLAPAGCLCQIIDVVVSSAFKAEYAALFMNAQHSIYLRNILIDPGYPQLPTIIYVTTSVLLVLTLILPKQKDPKQSTCVGIESEIKCVREYLICTGVSEEAA